MFKYSDHYRPCVDRLVDQYTFCNYLIKLFITFSVLPELPVPGPTPHGNPTPGSNILYQPSIVEDANNLLSNPTEQLASQVSALLSNTNIDYVELSDKNSGSVGHQVPPNNLAAMMYRVNPALFDGHNHRRNSQQQQQQWGNATNNYNQVNNFGYQHRSDTVNYNNAQGSANAHHTPSPSAASPMQAAQPQAQPEQEHYPNQMNRFVDEANVANNVNNYSGDQQAPSGAYVNDHSAVNKTSDPTVPNNVVKPSIIKPSLTGGGNVIKPSLTSGNSNGNVSNAKEPKIMLNKLSKEAEEMMKQSLNSFNRQHGQDKSKAEEMGVYDGYTTRSQRSLRSRTTEGDVESESDSDSESPRKARNKFFKASEKEREEEKRKNKGKRKLEDGDFEPQIFGKRRRREPTPDAPASPKPFVPKKVTRTIQRNLIPMIPKINVEEYMEEDNTFKRFNKTVDLIFENMEEINMQDFEQMDDGAEIPQEILIQKYHLKQLAAETAKLKSLGVMESISPDRLVKLLNILELNIRDGSKVVPLPSGDDDDDSDDRLWLELALERVMRAADASLSVLNILTSKKMSKRVYIDDVIDRVALFLRFQLSNTIYPSYDPVYKEISKSKTGYVSSMKKKRSYAHGVRDRNILDLYNKTHELTSMLADLVKMQLLTDTTILHISTLGVAPFFVESIPELQLAALKLVTNLFSKYEKHRKLLLDDILASIARLPSSKRSLRSYRLNSTTYIQMLTALVLQLIQCVVILPRKLATKDDGKNAKKKDEEVVELDSANELDRDVLIDSKYGMAMGTAHQFLTVFLKKCGSKNEDIDYRPLFENFVQDLLTTVNTPEWPAAELLLSLLGRVLREKFKDRSTEMALRISSLEYLGVVAARLRKDAVQSKMKLDYIDSIIKLIREEEERDTVEEELDPVTGKKKKKKKKIEDVCLDKEEERDKFLQRVLLDYLAVNGGEDDQAAMNARHFYICQWFRDINAMGRKPKVRKKKVASNRKKRKDSTSDEEESSPEEESDEEDMNDSKKNELYQIKEARKDLLVQKIPPFGISKGNKAQVLSTHIDHDSALLIVKYLSSKRPFFNSFNFYLQDILNVCIDPRGQPTITAGSDYYFHTCHPYVLPYVRFFKTEQFSKENSDHYWRGCWSGRGDH